MASAKDVDVDTISQVVGAVQQVVARFYGPQCQQTLLTSQTGQAVITSDGLTILDTLQPSHPVAELVTKAVRSCLRHTQDGCKTFLNYLAAILKHLQSNIHNGRFRHSGTNATVNKKTLNHQGALAVVRSLHVISQEILPAIYDEVSSHSCQLYTALAHTMSDVELLQGICKTTLAAHYNPNLCDFLSGVAMKFLDNELVHCLKTSLQSQTTGTGCDIQKCLQFSLDHFGVLCVKVSNRSYTECTVLPSLLIQRDFAVKVDKTLAKTSVSILLLNVTEEVDDEKLVDFRVKHESSISNLILQKRQTAENFVNRCAAKGVDIVLSSEAIPGFILDKFRQQNISVVSNVLREDVDMMEQLTGKFSIGWQDDIITSQNLIKTGGVQKLGLGGRVYLHVKIKPLVTVNHLVVCASTVGLCDQAAMALQKALTTMLMCFKHHKNSTNRESHCSSNSYEENGCIESNPTVPRSTQSDKTKFNSNESCQDTNDPTNSVSQVCHSDTLGKQNMLEPDKLATNEKQNVVKPGKLNTSGKQNGLEPEDLQKLNISANLMLIEGGGGFELLMSKLLTQHAQINHDPNLSIVLETLSESLLHSVKVLYDNTAATDTSSSRGFLEVKQVLQDKLVQGTVWGLSRRGQPCDVRERGVLEPLNGKLHVLTCVLGLVEQLLKTDKIVSVKKLQALDE